MANLNGNPNATLTLAIRQLELTDPAHPNTWNPQLQTLINNDAVLDRRVRDLEGDSSLLARIAALEAINAGSRLTALEGLNAGTRLTTLEGAQSVLSGRVASLESTVVPLDGRVTALQNWRTGIDDGSGKVPWTAISGKPAQFPPAAHTHPTSDVTGLDTALNNLSTQISDHQSAADPHPQYLNQARGDARYTRTQASAAPAAVTPGASPFTYTNSGPNPAAPIVQGGTVGKLEYSRDGTTFYDLGVTAGLIYLASGDSVRITYTAAPTLTTIPL